MKVLALGYLFVAAGGALGAVARFALNLALQRDTNYPWGTLMSNLLGCLVMGVVAYLVANSQWFNSAGIVFISSTSDDSVVKLPQKPTANSSRYWSGTMPAELNHWLLATR